MTLRTCSRQHMHMHIHMHMDAQTEKNRLNVTGVRLGWSILIWPTRRTSLRRLRLNYPIQLAHFSWGPKPIPTTKSPWHSVHYRMFSCCCCCKCNNLSFPFRWQLMTYCVWSSSLGSVAGSCPWSGRKIIALTRVATFFLYGHCNFVHFSASGGCPVSSVQCPLSSVQLSSWRARRCLHSHRATEPWRKYKKITHALAVELGIGDCGLGTGVRGL